METKKRERKPKTAISFEITSPHGDGNYWGGRGVPRHPLLVLKSLPLTGMETSAQGSDPVQTKTYRFEITSPHGDGNQEHVVSSICPSSRFKITSPHGDGNNSYMPIISSAVEKF